eukprot:1279388-Amphidinium_carterae.2
MVHCKSEPKEANKHEILFPYRYARLHNTRPFKPFMTRQAHPGSAVLSNSSTSSPQELEEEPSPSLSSLIGLLAGLTGVPAFSEFASQPQRHRCSTCPHFSEVKCSWHLSRSDIRA